ncbi:MAG: glycoside hydrolase family 3 C-terminal domain-containing protein [Acidobacteria bacterium]|nr:glycoside hydrolase family 3 C-terminal domain-containing protein [Acidobacteriota bacterium]
MTLSKTTTEWIFISILCIFLFLSVALFPQSPDSEASEYRLEPPDQAWVDKTLDSMTLREKIGQLIQIRVHGKFVNRQDEAFKELKEKIEQYNIGGVVLFAGNIYESSLLLNELQSYSRVPLLVSADFERGAAFRIDDTTSFPWNMAIGATGSEEFAYQQGMITARESRALGVHWLFAPVVDVNNNPENPVINIRSYGEDPRLVARLGSAFIRGARAGGALTTAKHFPGHGDTASDTHIGLAVVPSDFERLDSVELVPFKSAIDAGVDAVMTAHIAVPKVTEDPEVPATLSREILTGLLRHTLQFDGIVVTDALEMGGIRNHYWSGLAAVRAIQAGADIVLLPTNVAVAVNEIERAFEMGLIPVDRIDASVSRILRAKSSLGLHRERTVSIDRLKETIASPQNEAFAQKIADHSITAVKNNDLLLPITPVDNPKIFSLVLDSGLATDPGDIFQSEMRKVYPSLITEWANARVSKDQIDNILKYAKNSDLIVCATFARVSSGRNIIGIPEDQQAIIEKLLKTKKPFVWVAFGNPYVLERFPKVGTYLCTFSYSDVSQRAVVKAISGAIPISGKMPVSIPEHAAVGDGLEIPKLEMVLKAMPNETADYLSDTLENTRQIIFDYIKSGEFSDAQLIAGYKGSTILDIDYHKDLPPFYSENDSSGLRLPMSYVWGNGSFGTIFSAMLATESGGLLLDALVQDYLPEQQDTDLGKIPVSDLLADIHGKSKTASGKEISNRTLIDEIVSRASGSTERMMTELPREFAPETTGAGWQNSYLDNNVAVFSQMLLNNGIYNHRRIFKPDTIVRFKRSHKGTVKALGWMKPAKTDWTGRLFSHGSFGLMDDKGHFLWIDPQKQLFIVFEALPIKLPEETTIEEAYEKITRSIIYGLKKDNTKTQGR